MKKITVNLSAEELKKKLNLKDGYTPKKGIDYFDGETPVINTSELALEASKLAQVELEKKIQQITPIIEPFRLTDQDIENISLEVQSQILPNLNKELEDLKKGFKTWKPAGGNTEVFKNGIKVGSGQALNFGTGFNVTHNGHRAEINFSQTEAIPVGSITFNTSYTPTGTEPVGTTYFDDANHTISTVLENGAILQHGFELYTYGTDEGNDFPEGSPVSVKGATGNRVAFELTDITDNQSADNYIGLITTPVDSGNRLATREGAVRGINTTGTPWGETWAEGDQIYVGLTPGSLTNVEPTSNRVIRVGTVTNRHATQGIIELDRLIIPTLQDVTDSGATTNKTITLGGVTIQNGSNLNQQTVNVLGNAIYDVSGLSPFHTFRVDGNEVFRVNEAEAYISGVLSTAHDIIAGGILRGQLSVTGNPATFSYSSGQLTGITYDNGTTKSLT